LVYSHIWLNHLRDDHHFAYKHKLLKEKLIHWEDLHR